MTDTTPWVPLEGRDLLIAVRDVLVENPERHNQEVWIGNKFRLTGSEINIPVDLMRPYAYQPLPAEPADPSAAVPACGSTGCAFGWAAVFSTPPGTLISNGKITLPDGEEHYIGEWVTEKMDIGSISASHIFSPLLSRERLIRMLNALILDPEARIYGIQ